MTTTVISTVTNGVGNISFTGGGSAAIGEVGFVGNTATSGFLNITAGTNMGTYTLSPGSGNNTVFLWDGLVYPTSDPFLDPDGLLFTNDSVEINLYGNGPGSYTLVGVGTTNSNVGPLVTNGVATLAVCSQMITRTWDYRPLRQQQHVQPDRHRGLHQSAGAELREQQDGAVRHGVEF